MKRVGSLLALAALAIAGACSDSPVQQAGGRTQVLLTDAPFPFDSISRVDVYVARIQASTLADSSASGFDSSWVTVAEPMRTFNLLELSGGRSALAGETAIPAGQYRAIRMVINTTLSSVTAKDGTPVHVEWFVNGEFALNALVENPLAVPVEGGRIVIDFDVGRTFQPDGSGGLLFLPWIRAVNDAGTGTIHGVVTGPDVLGNLVPLTGITVLAFHSAPGVAGAIAASSPTDALGRFTLSFLPEGAYGVTANAPSIFVLNTGARFVNVTAGGDSVVNLVMARDTSGIVDTTGTGGGGGSGPVATVTITPASQTVSVGDSIGVYANLFNAQGQTVLGRVVTFASSDSTIVAFQGVYGQSALLRALRSGTVSVTAVSEGVTGTATIVVR